MFGEKNYYKITGVIVFIKAVAFFEIRESGCFCVTIQPARTVVTVHTSA